MQSYYVTSVCLLHACAVGFVVLVLLESVFGGGYQCVLALSLSLSLSHTHTHTHTLSLSLSPAYEGVYVECGYYLLSPMHQVLMLLLYGMSLLVYTKTHNMNSVSYSLTHTPPKNLVHVKW